MPPDSSSGYASSKPLRPTSSICCLARAIASVLVMLPCASTPKMTLPRTVRHGRSPGCWNTIARSRPGLLISRPSSVRLPPAIGMRPSTAFRNVVLPHPDGPTIARSSPGRTSRSTPFTAVNSERDRCSQYSMTTPFAASFAERSYIGPSSASRRSDGAHSGVDSRTSLSPSVSLPRSVYSLAESRRATRRAGWRR